MHMCMHVYVFKWMYIIIMVYYVIFDNFEYEINDLKQTTVRGGLIDK